jgi:uncharacterized protein
VNGYGAGIVTAIAGLGTMAWMAGFPLYLARKRSVTVIQWPGIFPIVRDLLVGLVSWLGIIVVLYAVLWLLRSAGLEMPRTDQLGQAIGRAPAGYRTVLLVLVIVAGPVAEEVFFRGFLFNVFRQKMAIVPAAVLQAALFGIGHYYNLSYVLVTFVLGLLLAAVYARRQSLLVPIFIHFLQNLLAALVAWAIADAAAQAPFLGVQGDSSLDGFIVRVVIPDSPIDRAGVRPGDVITGLGGYQVRDLTEVRAVLRLRAIGDDVEVQYRRDGETHFCTAVLGKRPD